MPHGLIHDEDKAMELVEKVEEYPGLAGQTYRAPKVLNAREFMRVENQSATSTCGGQGYTSGAEWCNKIATGVMEQYSVMFSYLTAQKIGGFFGKDEGVDIMSLIKSGEQHGVCEDSLLPFTGSYFTEIAEACYENAEPRKMKKHYMLASYGQGSYSKIYEFLASGQGAVICGKAWKESSAKNTDGYIEEFGGATLGGHCTVYLGINEKTDREFQPYLDELNSHSIRWGKKGWAANSPRMIQQVIDTDPMAVFIGISDISTPKPREFSWLEEGIYQSVLDRLKH